MTMNVNAFQCDSIGLTAGNITICEQPDGSWIARSKIGAIYGVEVDGYITGIGKTKEEALFNYDVDHKSVSSSIWR